MAYCVKCGARVDDGLKFCPYCKAEIPGAAERMDENGTYENSQNYTYYQGETYKNQTYTGPYYQDSYQDSQSRPGFFAASEVRKNKLMGVLSYLGILVLIPLLAGAKSFEYVRHHANQGLVLFVVSTIIDLLEGKWIMGFHSWINFGGGWFSWLFDIASFACFILFIMGIVSACKGTTKELPIIGKIKVLK